MQTSCKTVYNRWDDSNWLNRVRLLFQLGCLAFFLVPWQFLKEVSKFGTLLRISGNTLFCRGHLLSSQKVKINEKFSMIKKVNLDFRCAISLWNQFILPLVHSNIRLVSLLQLMKIYGRCQYWRYPVVCGTKASKCWVGAVGRIPKHLV